MANKQGHFSFTSMPEQGPQKLKDSSEGATKIEVTPDRRQPMSDDSSSGGGHYPCQLVTSSLEYEPVHANVPLLKAELKAITNDRDILRRELSRMQSQLDGYKQLGFIGIEKSPPNHNYDWLKSQCDQAMSELQSLKELHSDTVKKCDSAMSRADLYKQHYERAKESHAMMRSQYADALAERQNLEEEREELRRMNESDQREIEELRKQQREAIGQGTSFEEFSLMYDKMVGRYDALKQDFEALRKQYSESVSSAGVMSAKAEALQEENNRLRKQNIAFHDEKKNLHEYLQQNLHNYGLEKKSLVQELTKAKQEKEMAEQKLSQLVSEKMKENKDLGRLRNERNEVLKEYQLVMSERDSVHKEMEELQDVITKLNAKLTTVITEKSSAIAEIERLRQMLRGTRDNYVEEVTSLESEQAKILREFDQMLEITSSDRDTLNPYLQSGKTEALGQYSRDAATSKEVEILRKDLEKAQSELMDALHDLEGAKQQRDWAFGERDKIVKERESIRTLCDKLRHERDGAVSELIGALRDSDELKRQKSDVMKELKELKEKYEVLVEKEAAHRNRLSTVECSHSRDSAIDTDLQEWETETLEIEIDKIHSTELGFDLVGGSSDPQFPNDPSVFVRSIQPNSPASGKLKASDQLIRVNDVDVSMAEKSFVYQLLRNCSDPVLLVVRRRKLASSRAVFPVHIYRSGDREIGISLEQGLYVNRLMPGSLAAKEGNLAVGDRILNVNGFSLESRSASDAMRIFSEAGNHIVLNVLRSCKTPTSSLVSSASMFSGTNFDGYSDGDGFRSPRDSSWKSPMDELSLGENTALKSSSSQTDGLNSCSYVEPSPGSGFERSSHDKNIFDKAMNAIAKPFRSSRAMRDMRSKSTHPFVNTSSIEAWRQLSENIAECHSPQEQIDSPPLSKVKMKNHGTWPKCRLHVDYTGQSDLPSGVLRSRAERPRLSQVTRNSSNLIMLNATEHKVPPLPPTRSDSIKRSSSIKHSPQNSDSVVKYAASKGSVTNVVQRCEKPQSDTFRNNCETGQGYVVDTRGTSTSQSKDSDYVESTAGDPRMAPSPTGPVGLRNLQVAKYQFPYLGSKVLAASHRPDRRPQDMDVMPNDLWRPEPLRLAAPQKPTSLDVHPIYSQRPNNQDGGFPRPLDFGSEAKVSATKPIKSEGHNRFQSRPIPWTKPAAEPAFKVPPVSSSSDQTSYFQNNICGGMIRPSLSYLTGSLASTGDYHGVSGLVKRSPASPGSPIALLPIGRSLGPTIPETPDLELSSSSNKDDSQASSSPSPMVSNLFHRFDPPASSSKLPHQSDDLQGEFYSLLSQRSGPLFHERIRIPSSPSIVSSRSSGGGVMSSPSSYNAINGYLSSVAPYTLPQHGRHPPVAASSSLPKMVSHEKLSRTRPHLGESRSITVEMNDEPLGIRIESSHDGGIFVSSVGENSIASEAGIEIGDQLLEVCGINMRNATKKNATRILRQCVGTVDMLVQYNPDKYRGRDVVEYRGEDLTGSDETSDEDDHDGNGVNSKSRDNFRRGSVNNRARASNATITPETFLAHATFSHSGPVNADDHLRSSEPRLIMRKKPHAHDPLGVELAGGNLIGIFVKHVLPGSLLGGPKGVRIGDQILEFNNKDFRSLTLEQAIVEINKPCDQVICHAHYNFPLFLRTESQSGDGFYVQALYNRPATCSSELSFKRGDILFVENTVLNGRIGTWWAYLVNEDGDKLKCGTMPSKTKLEEELSHRRSLVDVSSCQASGTVRRSFFQRHRHRHGSRDGHEPQSVSDASLNDSIHPLDDMPVTAIECINKFDNSILRPVMIIGAFAEQIVKKITSESPDKFCKYDTDNMSLSSDDNAVVEYRTASDGMYKLISINAVRQIMSQGRHCLLAVPPETIEKLQKALIFPIVLFIKYKSQKQIREVKDACFIPEKVSNKTAKDLFEQGQDYEHRYKRLFTDSIPGGNLAGMCCQIKMAIDREQKKTLWVPSSASI